MRIKTSILSDEGQKTEPKRLFYKHNLARVFLFIYFHAHGNLIVSFITKTVLRCIWLTRFKPNLIFNTRISCHNIKKIFPTETESARLLLSYKTDLIIVQKGLEIITCIIWHILNLYTRSYGYRNALMSYLPDSEVAAATTTPPPARTPMVITKPKVNSHQPPGRLSDSK